MNATLTEEEVPSLGIQYGMLHQLTEELHIGRKVFLRLLGRLPFGENHVVFVGQPTAGFYKGLTRHFHNKRNRASVSIAYKTFVCISSHVEGKRWVAVCMKRTEGFVLLHLQAESVGYSLYGEIP